MKLKKFISITILLALVILFVYYLKNHLSDFKQLSFVNPYYLIVVVVLFIILYGVIAYVNLTLLIPLKVKLGFLEAFGLSIVTGFYNFITPFRGGAVVRAVYLKKKHNFPYVHFLSTLSAIYILTFLIASFLGLVSIYLIYLSEGIFSWILFFVFFVIFVSLLFVMIFSPKFPESKNKWINRFIKVINGWYLIKNNKKIIPLLSLLYLIQILIGSLMLYLQFQVFGIEINLIKCLFLVSIGSLGLLISITPASLGITETITVFSAMTIGITPIQSLPAILLGRAVKMLVIFILGPIFSYILLKHKPNKQENETENKINIEG